MRVGVWGHLCVCDCVYVCVCAGTCTRACVCMTIIIDMHTCKHT